MNPVWFHHGNEWHVLRSAWPGGRVTALCMWARDFGMLLVATSEPTNGCPACKRELAAGTPGAAETPDVSRAETVDLRAGRAPHCEWDDDAVPLAIDEVAFDDVSRRIRRPA